MFISSGDHTFIIPDGITDITIVAVADGGSGGALSSKVEGTFFNQSTTATSGVGGRGSIWTNYYSKF